MLKVILGAMARGLFLGWLMIGPLGFLAPEVVQNIAITEVSSGSQDFAKRAQMDMIERARMEDSMRDRSEPRNYYHQSQDESRQKMLAISKQAEMNAMFRKAEQQQRKAEGASEFNSAQSNSYSNSYPSPYANPYRAQPDYSGSSY